MPRDLIVLGDDGSPHSDRAWLWINNQRWPGWSVDVVTAKPRRGDVAGADLPTRLEAWTPDVPRSADPRTGIEGVRHLRSSADPRQVLAESEASLVVVGPRGAGGMARAMFLGSTADHLLHAPPGPLVIASTPNPVSRVLVCADGSSTARHAAETFAALPLAADAEVGVIGVDPDELAGEHHDRDDISRGITEVMETLAHLDPEPIRVPSEGDVAARIIEYAHALRIQLLVLGTRGSTGLERLLLGSTCHALARTAPCTLLVVPPPTD
jgi:nucleotide-binding universal stress UspA family protein